MKALITGINGFVGRYLAEYLLNQNMDVCGTYLFQDEKIELSNAIQLYKMDVSNEEEIAKVLKETKPDFIFHLAAQSSAAISWKNPQKTMEININGTINLLENIRKLALNCKILLIGSSEEYGFVRPEDMPVRETHALEPGNPYAVSKIAQSMIGQIYARAYGMDIIMVRAFNHIGPKQSPTFVVSDFAKRIAEIEKGQREPVLLVGNLEAERDFTDVRDIVRAYYELINKGRKGELYNIGSGNSFSIQYILDMLLSLSNKKIEVKQDPNRMRPSDVPVIQCDNTKLVKLTSWRPEYTIERTLTDVLNYWREMI